MAYCARQKRIRGEAGKIIHTPKFEHAITKGIVYLPVIINLTTSHQTKPQIATIPTLNGTMNKVPPNLR